MKRLACVIVFAWLCGWPVFPATAAFSSLYVFGDSVSSTTDNPDGGSDYYPFTYSNGRVWIQVLAQRLGVTYDPRKSVSYFDHTSAILAANLSGFTAADANTALFVLWVCDADFADYLLYTYPTYGLDPTRWNNAITNFLANHQTIIQTLYNKGARTFLMPNAVDVAKIPEYAGMSASERSFIRQGIVRFNSILSAIVNQARASLPGIKIHVPDFFALEDDMLAYPGKYGLVNPGYAATQNSALYPLSLSGPGAYYVFWDPWDPTAKAHEIMADTAKQLGWPVKIGKAAWADGTAQLTMENVPIGLVGAVDGKTNLTSTSWAPVAGITSTSATQIVSFPASATQQFYRLRFPFAWSWP